jgi:hypothetical protein
MLQHAETFVKTLSSNDVGATGAHQGGVLIPRVSSILNFFPPLNTAEVNPRETVEFIDVQSGAVWTFNYIYYNGVLTGASSRNEYRLTGMTAYLRDNDVVTGDQIELSRSVSGTRYISHVPQGPASAIGPSSPSEDPDVIVLSGTWKTIKKAIHK